MQQRWEENHIFENGIIYKWCNSGEHWVEENDENFYKSKCNSTDGYYPDCKPCSIRDGIQWVKDNREKHNKYKRQVYKENRFNAREIIKKSNQRRKELGKEKEWQQQNPDKVNEYSKNHRQKDHRISEKEWDSCKFYFNHRCAYCGLPIEEHYVRRKGKLQWQDFHKEHVIHDGRIDIKNCVPSCQSCNSSKHTASLNNWYNKNNPVYTYERYYKIYKWLRYDHKNYIQKRKPKGKYVKKSR